MTSNGGFLARGSRELGAPSGPPGVQVDFLDSSDDDAEHHAAIRLPSGREGSLVTDTTTRPATGSSFGSNATSNSSHHPYGSRRAAPAAPARQGTGGGGMRDWLTQAIQSGSTAAANLILGRAGTEPHEPFPGAPHARAGGEEGTSNNDDDDGSSWEFGSGHRRRRARASSSSGDEDGEEWNSERRGGNLEEEPYNEVELQLDDMVYNFLERGSEVDYNMILATLKLSSEVVSNDLFIAVSASPLLIRPFLDSGRVDVEDPLVQEIVQEKLDEAMQGDAYTGDVLPPGSLDYIRCLCSVQSSRVTRQQMVLLRYSGFDYIEILIDFPYLTAHLEPQQHCSYLLFRAIYLLNIVASWIGVLVTLLFNGALLWTCVYWFSNPVRRNNGYWTIIAYVGGYVLSLVATLRAEEGKIQRYDGQIWSYPDNNLKIIPILPVYEIFLSYVALRYELKKDRRRHSIIRYDLRNGSSLQQVSHGFFNALPQIILQIFLFTDHVDSRQPFITAPNCWLVVGAGGAQYLMSIIAFHKIVLFSHSCSVSGFAQLSSGTAFAARESATATSRVQRRVLPSAIATRLLLFFTLYFLCGVIVTLFIFLLNMSQCDAEQWVLVGIYIGIAGISVLLVVLLQVYLRISRWMGVLAIAPILMEIAYMIFVREYDENTDCVISKDGLGGWIIPTHVTFGLMCLSMISWFCMVMFEVHTKKRIQQVVLDNMMVS